VDGVVTGRDAWRVRRGRGGLVEVKPARRVGGPAKATPIVRDDAVSLGKEEARLVVPIILDSGQPWLTTMGCPLPQSV
jgi:hypothetical protein